MVLDKLTGVYFDETVDTIVSDVEPLDEKIQFIIQTSSAIASLDHQLVYTSIADFQTAVSGKNLTKTTEFIEYIASQTGHTSFFVYSVKTDTAAGWKEAVMSSELHKEIKKVFYFEENASSNNNTFKQKMSAIISGCDDCFKSGAFRRAYGIPYATVTAAVAADSNTAPAATVTTTMTAQVNGLASGKLSVLVPEFYLEQAAKIVSSEYYEEIGKGTIATSETDSRTYPLDKTQILTLRNAGIVVPRPFYRNGRYEYEIELGVTTSWDDDKADGLIVARTIADELLREVDINASTMIKDAEHEGNVEFIQTCVDDVIADFVKNKYVNSNGTKLTVVDNGDLTFNISGKITPTRTLVAINVNTTLS